MKNFQKFADKQLSKQEMNHVKGGTNCNWHCILVVDGAYTSGTACGDTADEIYAYFLEMYKQMEGVDHAVNCRRK